ncbi:MAG: hypothetical protein AAGH15_26400 [Myxococcota bacterium]
MRPELDIIDVKKPCKVSWAGMQGEGAVRHCGHCRKIVYDLSAMTRADAEELITLGEGDLCVRFRRRADGTLVTADCPPPRSRGRRVRRLAMAGMAATGLASVTMMGAPIVAPEPVMGTMVAPLEAPLMGEPVFVAPPEPAPDTPPEDAPELDAYEMGEIAYEPE